MVDVLDREALSEALQKHGLDMDPAEFITVFEETVDASTDTLTQAEATFLTEQGGVDPALLTPAQQAAAQARINVAAARANTAVTPRGLTTRDVATMVGTAPANVRRSTARGDLYTAGHGPNREHVFPAWQFDNGRPLNHLREVIAAFPADMHPLDVETVMTAPHEMLGGRSPAEWLATGGDPAPVTRLVGELARW